MKSGIKIRNKSLTIAAIIGAFFQNFFVDYIESLLVLTNLTSKFSATVINLLTYGLFFLLSVFLCQAFSKVPWIRVHLFKEKIVEGKWFECIYLDSEHTKLFSYGIVDTFFDDNGEFVYKGYDYALGSFAECGEFCSTCSSLKYHDYDNRARLDYAYEFEHNNQRDQGYGCINFTVSNYGSNRHYGKFFNSDGVTYYFSAILISDKAILKDLASGSQLRFFSAMQKLVDAYDADRISRREKISELYEISPETFAAFCKQEDCDKNLANEISKTVFADKVVLDMGVGTGRMSEGIIPSVKHLICSDSSAKMLGYLKQSGPFKQYSEKIDFVNCDHMALPFFLDQWKGKIDVIIAGYTIGAYFNNEFSTLEQKQKLIHSIIESTSALLADGGTFMIIETLGLVDATGKRHLLNHDAGLTTYFHTLDTLGFEKTEVDTSFRFTSQEEAIKTIGSFWGSEGANLIRKEGKFWVLNETSCVWKKQLNTSVPSNFNA